MKIFWSWQSDTSQDEGRYFVRDVIAKLSDELIFRIDKEKARARRNTEPEG
jgi:hypothetical protein